MMASAAVIGGKSRGCDYHHPCATKMKMKMREERFKFKQLKLKSKHEGEPHMKLKVGPPLQGEVELELEKKKCILEKQWNQTDAISGRRRRRRRKPLLNEEKKNKMKMNIDIDIVRGGGGGGRQQQQQQQQQQQLLSHSQVVLLSTKIKTGLSLQHYKSKLKQNLGYDPSQDQLATTLRISQSELQLKLIEFYLAREKLAMSNIRLVISIAKKYDNMGAEMADLVQGGLIGLVRGIEKFDSSKGFKISTYVYWWIRQGVSRALVENSRTLRLPAHLHERLSLIRNAKLSLEEKGITPSTERIAKWLNLTEKKVKNATEATRKVFSLDKEAFPSLNGLRAETLHSYIADNRLENNPWHGVDEWTLKEEVNDMIKETLREREQDIVRLYYGLDAQPLTWEDISKRIGLSRERVRQVGLVALEKLKHAARKRNLEALLFKQ